MSRKIVVDFVIDRCVTVEVADDGSMKVLGVDEDIANIPLDFDDVWEDHGEEKDPTNLYGEEDLWEKVCQAAYPYRFYQGTQDT